MAVNHLNRLRPLLCQSLARHLRCAPVVPANLSSPMFFPDSLSRPTACIRLYATKKAKAKTKGQAAKVNISAALVEDIISLEEVKEDMAAVVNALKDDFTRNLSIRTSPGALDHIVVSTPDGKFPLNQLGQVSMKSPQLIMINMSSYPEATSAAARALRESSMNLNPEVDGTIIKVPVPKVTREHRENLAKTAKQFSNKAKDSLRRVRSNAVTQVKKAKEGQSEDTIRLIEKQIQQMADNIAADIDKQLAAKTKELLG
ncbi:ribosome-recycling factor, mitochondrial [Syngnathus scovelli]|uniref:ribosome-recycling factor, mitochondrial n=1 Tax=Syngnathus scovelli TaxID=161590 RepID=UPI00210F7773|nr:ribosome-recycling factor, mitochondrial [Syngnathus scovelli]XP_049595149.1 ribosome-recycling factor, mitochondrial [Syngnathus scovelli]XP_049595150.1 ribosome-recycling factor, mitochondrial [Syngnathus scovelli]XP_049595151.1 ribosome-recycling factor, mitochondrial [Syngnathus scovelli]XP_049595152.1 ribosome-recycling factor, mitochondrial [Syngnathus scovelli]XP_049595153.1 ribosome-recycling factor, mitochondrial [Syngnathus scovelli]